MCHKCQVGITSKIMPPMKSHSPFQIPEGGGFIVGAGVGIIIWSVILFLWLVLPNLL